MTFLTLSQHFSLKSFNLHAVYVGFHVPGTRKLLNYVYFQVVKNLCKSSFAMVPLTLKYGGGVRFSKKSLSQGDVWGTNDQIMPREGEI